MQLKGEGSLNLNNEALYANFFAKATMLDTGLSKIQQVLGGSFPILITGTLSAPKVVPDLQKINPILTKILLRKPVKQLSDSLKDILEKGQKAL